MIGYICENARGITMYASRKSAKAAARRAEKNHDGNGVVAEVLAGEHVNSLVKPVSFTGEDQSIGPLARAIYLAELAEVVYQE